MPCSVERSCSILRKASSYQMVLPNGHTKLLVDMDAYEMMEALMNSVDTIERLDTRLARLAYLIDEWQTKGSSKPTRKRNKGSRK